MGKLEIIENREELVLEYKDKLFSKKMMARFTGGASLSVLVIYGMTKMTFPLLLLGAGTFSVFMSILRGKNTIRVKRDSITLQMKSWLFNKTVTIPTKDLIQIYVKERNYTGDLSNYTLHAKQTEGKETINLLKFLTIKEPKEAQLMEQKIQDFLGIKDFQIHGEFRGKLKKPLRVNTPIPQIKERNPTELNIKDLEMGAFLDYELVTWEVVYQTQYDWDRKITEIQFQLSDHKGHSMLLFVQRYEKYPSTWSESKVSYRDLETYKLRDILYSPPTQLTFKDQLYFRKNIGTGKKFIPNEREGLAVKQWHYITADEKDSLRILQYEGKGWAAFSGKKIEEFEFENILTS
jgi:hypothetical protein